MNSTKSMLISIFAAAIKAVAGRQTVRTALSALPNFKPDQIIAVGKAASEMALGGLDVYLSIPTLVVTKHDHCSAELLAHPAVTVITAGHPIPDENSLLAGQMLVERVAGMSKSDCLLLLVSGGASALAEQLPQHMTLAHWQTLNRAWIASGQTIAQINQQRQQLSQIKAGRLLARFSGAEVVVLAISDVQEDGIATIGSGIGDCRLTQAKATTQMVATNHIARQAAALAAVELGLEVLVNQETLYGEVVELSEQIGGFLRQAGKGLYLFGGEPTIVLPPRPGNGGRNQSLALALAKQIYGSSHITILVAGTDGSDGPTDAAGAIIDGATFCDQSAAQLALDQANAGDYLRQHDAIFVTGPTGTNVMDLLIAIVE